METLDIKNQDHLYYLAGLVESNLRIRFKRKTAKLTAFCSINSLYGLYLIQQVFGGIVQRSSSGHPYLSFNSTQIGLISETLFRLSTPYISLYQSIIKLKQHQSSLDQRKFHSDVTYKNEYKDNLDLLRREVISNLQPIMSEKLLPPSYYAGLVEGLDNICISSNNRSEYIVSINRPDPFAILIDLLFDNPKNAKTLNLSQNRGNILKTLLPFCRIRINYLSKLPEISYCYDPKIKSHLEPIRLLRYPVILHIENLLKWADEQNNIDLKNNRRLTEKIHQRISAKEKRRQERRRLRDIKKQQKRESYQTYLKKIHARSIERKRVRDIQRIKANEIRTAAKIEQYNNLLSDISQGIKMCGHCNKKRLLACFHINKHEQGGYTRYCKQCQYEQYTRPNRKNNLIRTKIWQAANPEKFKASQLKQRQKPHIRLRNTIRRRIKRYLNQQLPPAKHIEYLGCSMVDFKTYLETLFLPGMTWNNYGKKTTGWVIDHIIPHTSFKLTNDTHLKWCWNYRNLRPLWDTENSLKSDLINNTSVRQLRAADRYLELHEMIGTELEKLQIATKNEYLSSL